MKILEELDRGVNANRLAIDYGVCKSSISYIKSQKENILAAVSNSFQEAKKKTLHKPEYVKMEEQVYDWFLLQL